MIKVLRVNNLRYVSRVANFSTEGKALHSSFLRSLKPDGNKADSPKSDIPKAEIPKVEVPKPNTTVDQTLNKVEDNVVKKESIKTTHSEPATKPHAPLFTQFEKKNTTNTVPKAATNSAALLEFAPRIKVIGVGGGGCNTINNMIEKGLGGVEFIAANTDAQHLANSLAEKKLQLGRVFTQGLGCGANPNYGRAAAEESRQDIADMLQGSHMVFITAGMGGGTGTGAAPVIAEVCAEMDILTVAVVTKPFTYEGRHRGNLATEGINALFDRVDTLIVVPNQNLFKLGDASTTHDEAMGLANDVLLAGVKSITDLMVLPGAINLDYADVRAVMKGMGYGMMGTGQADGPERAIKAANDALNNPLIGNEMTIRSAKGVLVNITGAKNDLTLHEVDQAAKLITAEIEDEHANIIFGTSHDENLKGAIRISVVATGIEQIPPTPPVKSNNAKK